MKAETIILGNVITMDEFKPYAEAIAVADEKIIYVGSRDAAMRLQDDKTMVSGLFIIINITFSLQIFVLLRFRKTTKEYCGMTFIEAEAD